MTPRTATRTGSDGSRRPARLQQPLLGRWLLGLAAAYVAFASVPVSIGWYGTGLDASWKLGLNLAHSQGLVAGRDIVFTYGPLGYLIYAEPVSGAPLLALVFQLGFYAVFVAALFRLAWILPSPTTALWTAVILGLAVVLYSPAPEAQILLAIDAVALIALVDVSDWRYAELALFGFLSGLGLLAKLNQGIEGAALFPIVLATVAYRDRPLHRRAAGRLLVAAAVLPVSFVAMFIASTGSLSSIGPYARNGWQIVAGYSEAMSLPGPLWQAALACAMIGVTFLAVMAVTGDLRALWPGMAPALLITFFAFKYSMTRQGPGHAPAFQLRFAVALLFLLLCARTARDRRLIAILQLFSVVMGFAISAETYPGFAYSVQSRLELRQASAAIADFWHWRSTWEKAGADDRRNRASLRLPDLFHQLIGNGTVDAIPSDVDVVEANGWKWLPRPVFQSYSAYTPALDYLNAAHIEGPRAASFAILNFFAIDGRHPFLETPLSWRALLDHYDLTLPGSAWFLLHHRNVARFGPLTAIGNSTAHWNEDISLPRGDGLLVMSPRIGQSLRGKAASLLFRSTPVYMEAAFRSGIRIRWRCVPRNLAGGFLIRPFPRDLPELRGLFLPVLLPPSAEPVVSVRFQTAHPDEFAPEIPVIWSVLPVSQAETQTEIRDSRRFPLRPSARVPLWRAGDRLPRPSNARLQQRRGWIEVTPETGDPQLLFDIGPHLGQFRTLIVRAWFEKADRIDTFFGKQIDGRGISGIVPVTGQWLDVYLNMSRNQFWEEEHGETFRFDPVSSFGPHTGVRIAAIWGSRAAAPAALPDVQFYQVSSDRSLTVAAR